MEGQKEYWMTTVEGRTERCCVYQINVSVKFKLPKISQYSTWLCISCDILWGTCSIRSCRFNRVRKASLVDNDIGCIDLDLECSTWIGQSAEQTLELHWHHSTKTGRYPHITQLQIKLASPGILQSQPLLNIEVRVTVRIDDAEVTSFERYQKKAQWVLQVLQTIAYELVSLISTLSNTKWLSSTECIGMTPPARR